MNKTLKTILCIVLALCICGLVYAIYDSIMQPVRFNKDEAARENVAIQQLKDIRDLQVAFKGVNNKFTANFDSLKQFYNEGVMEVNLAVGSMDDSVAVAHTKDLTAQIRKNNKGISDAGVQQKLYELYEQGDEHIICRLPSKVKVNESILTREGFDINTIDIIPFSDGDKVEMEATVKKVSGVDVPLFEARMPYNSLLKGLDRQLVVNLNADREDQGRYQGLQVGSVTAPNNNAGNWE